MEDSAKFRNPLVRRQRRGLFYEEAGFRVDEAEYYHSLGLFHPESANPSERRHLFATETQACEYLASKIAEKVALYRHLASLGQRARQS